jgi:hypothetical protein
VFTIFLNKGFGSDFLKIVVERRINRRNNNKGRRRIWALARW